MSEEVQTPEPVVEPTPQPENIEQPVETPVAPENVTQTEVKFLADGTGKFVDGFEKFLPEDIRDHSAIKKHTTVADLFKAKIGAESLIGKKVSEYLESDNPAVVAERNKHFGVPEKAEDYKLDIKLPEGFEMGTEGIERFRKAALEMGLPEKYAQPLAQFETDLWVEHAQKQAEAVEAEKQAAEQALRDEWKADTYDKNLRTVKNLLTKELGLSDEDFSKPIGNNPALLKALIDKVVPAFGEDKLIEGGMTHSSESAEAQMLTLNKEMIGMNPNTPEYRAKLDEKKNLLSRMK